MGLFQFGFQGSQFFILALKICGLDLVGIDRDDELPFSVDLAIIAQLYFTRTA